MSIRKYRDDETYKAEITNDELIVKGGMVNLHIQFFGEGETPAEAIKEAFEKMNKFHDSLSKTIRDSFETLNSIL